jgi:tetratricopeptide (TPR) repeat protein
VDCALLNVTSVLFRRRSQILAVWSAFFIATVVLCPAAQAADRNSDKDKKKEDKKEKVEPWVQVQTPHFIVTSDAGEKTARRVADQFEQLRWIIQSNMPQAHPDTGIPIRVLAARNPQSFATLFPEFPVDKRRGQPNGQMVVGREKTYIGLRANVSGSAAYEDIYQAYAKSVLRRSYRDLPPWLEEGYINVFGSLVINDNGARMDKPNPEDLSVLWESPLLPLDIVLGADRSSPYYSAGQKDTVYFAESRALVHFLLSDPQMSGAKVLDRFLSQLASGTGALQAAHQSFGDFNQLQNKLEAYIKQSTSSAPSATMAKGGDPAGAARTLSAAESEALFADFAAKRGKNEDAQDKLEDALKQDPALADAEISFGFLMLHEDALDESEKHFQRAAELDPASVLAYYGQGEVALARSGNVGVPLSAVANLEKTVSLNPNFAPAWYDLASIYSLRTETMHRALEDAKRATALAPGEQNYQLQVAGITERLAHPENEQNASAQTRAAQGNSRSTDDRRSSGQIRPTVPPPPPGTAIASAPAPRSLRIERKTEPDQKPAESAASRTTEASAPSPVENNSHVYSMVGTISDVNCSESPQVRVTLKAQTIIMHLHAADIAHLGFKLTGSSSLSKISCAALRGRSARVSYLLVSGKEWDGEMQAVEFR